MGWTINRIFWFLCFLHRALWYNYAAWINEMHTFQINTSIQFFNFWCLLHVSNHPENEPKRFETCRRHKKIEKLNESIYLQSVHYVGSCCLRTFWHYGQRKQTSHCLTFISLLFDDSCQGKKFTCPSDLAIVLSGRYNTHLVTLSSMSVAH